MREAKMEDQEVVNVTLVCQDEKTTVTKGCAYVGIGIVDDLKGGVEASTSIVGNFSLERSMVMTKALYNAQRQLLQQIGENFGEAGLEEILAMGTEKEDK